VIIGNVTLGRDLTILKAKSEQVFVLDL